MLTQFTFGNRISIESRKELKATSKAHRHKQKKVKTLEHKHEDKEAQLYFGNDLQAFTRFCIIGETKQ